MVSWRGRREAVVIEIRRSRIVVELTQPYGQTRIVDIAADRVEAHQ
jgi:stress response protein YsnF